MLPVAAVQGAYLLFWVTACSVTDGSGNAVTVFALPAFPYLILCVVVLFLGPPQLIPVTLIAVLVASVIGFILSTLRRPSVRYQEQPEAGRSRPDAEAGRSRRRARH